MNQFIIDKFLSAERLSSYADLNEYKLNLQLSRQYYIPLSIVEIVLRNAIDSHLSMLIGYDWLDNDNFLQQDSKNFRDEAKQKLIKRRENLSKGKIIAELNFGFWITLFKEPYKKCWRTKNLKTFMPHMPNSHIAIITRHTLFSELNTIRKLRNRLFHHEKIINKKEFELTEQTIYKILNYFSPELEQFARTANYMAN